jgi:hypothetical protein
MLVGGLRAVREMWGRLPTFFYSRTLPRDNMNDELEHVVTEGLDEVGYDLVELRKGGSKSRPVLEVRIDRRDGEKVTVDDCARASRSIEARLDSGTLVAERYVLQVSSPGERRFGRRQSGVASSVAGRTCSRRTRAVGSKGRSWSWRATTRRRSSRCSPSEGRRSGFRSPRSRRRGWRFASNCRVYGSRRRRPFYREVLDGQFRRDVGRVP